MCPRHVRCRPLPNCIRDSLSPAVFSLVRVCSLLSPMSLRASWQPTLFIVFLALWWTQIRRTHRIRHQNECRVSEFARPQILTHSSYGTSREKYQVVMVREIVDIFCVHPPKLKQSAIRKHQNFTNFNNSKLIFTWYTEGEIMVCTWLGECCRQVEQKR